MLNAKDWIIVVLVIGMLSGYIFFTSALHTKDTEKQTALLNLQHALTSACDSARQLSESVSNEHDQKINDLNRRFTVDSVRGSACVPILAKTAPGSPGVPVPDDGVGHVSGHGVEASFLREYAKECRTYQVNFEACQHFVDGIYKLNAE